MVEMGLAQALQSDLLRSEMDVANGTDGSLNSSAVYRADRSQRKKRITIQEAIDRRPEG
jgi:hypothetical protein